MIRKALLTYISLLWCSQASCWVTQSSYNRQVVQVLRQRNVRVSSTTSCRLANESSNNDDDSGGESTTTISSRVTTTVKAVAASGLGDLELKLVLEAIQQAIAGSDSYLGQLDERFENLHVEFDSSDASSMSLYPAFQTATAAGTTGRVLILSVDDKLSNEGMDEIIQYVVAQAIDQLMYTTQDPVVKQPILVSMEQEEDLAVDANMQGLLEKLIQDQIFMYELTTPLPMSASKAAVLPESSILPTLQVEMDGDFVTDVSSSSQEQVWDTSSILVFDNLVSEDLRKRLLDVTLGGTSDSWDDVTHGPNPERWVRGGLIDIPDEDGQEEEEEEAVAPPTSSTSWGLSDEAIDDICFHHHDAIQEFECILSQVFPQFLVTRLPEAVFGDTVSPLTANAPTHNDEFSIHIDGDPNQAPPSPWTDLYGRYPNRIRGKPRFMSCLLYLNEEWEEEWGAQTRFLDLPTDKLYGVTPKPGRCVMMDQDCSHTVVAPNKSAGNRPRYSLVWKLILHPRENLQDMTDLAMGRPWPEPTLFGSAERKETHTQA